MNNDHKILVDIWTKLKAKRDVIILVDCEEDEDATVILDWFAPITKHRISRDEAMMLNDKLLCLRRILPRMPTLDPRAVGAYDVVVVSKQSLLEIKQGLQHE